MTQFFLAPGVYPRTLDMSERVQAVASSIGAIVLASRRGPMEDTLVTNRGDFLELYGNPDPSWGYGHYAALTFLSVGRQLRVKRLAPDAKYAGATIVNNRFGAAATETYQYKFANGRLNGWVDGAGTQQVILLVFAGDLVVSNTTTITVTDGDTETIVARSFAGGSANTIRNLADDLQTAINNAYAINGRTPGTVIAQEASIGGVRVIQINVPQGVTLDIDSAVVTGGASQTTISVQEDAWIMDIYARNPGAWAKDYGYAIKNINAGTNERWTISRSGDFVEDNVLEFRLTVKGVINDISVSFNTDNATTVDDLRQAILDAIGPSGDVLVSNDLLELTVIAPDDGPDVLSFGPMEATGGLTQPFFNATLTLNGIAKDDTFEIWVYSRDNTAVPIEKHLVSFKHQLDGFGQQQFIEEVINEGSQKSTIIGVRYNPANGAATWPTNSIGPGGTDIFWLGGGDDGSFPTASDYVNGWNTYGSRTKNNVRILINGGIAVPSVQQKMVSICEARRDCFAILDVPSAEQGADAAVTYRLIDSNINSSYAALYTPDVKILDEFSNFTMYVPPSGYVAAVYAFNDQVAAEWFAPAGFNRALLQNVIGLRHDYDQGELETLHPNQVNAIRRKPGRGYAVMDAETLQSKNSALRNISVRRMLITVEVSLVDALDYTLFEPHDPYTQFQVVQMCTNFLQPIKEARGLRSYLVVSDDNNNKPYHRDMGQLNVDVILEPVIPVKYIRLTSVITRQGAAFSEVIALLNSGS